MPLTRTDLTKLTYFKWRYSLEAMGFRGHEVNGLMFVRFWVKRGVIGGAMDGES